MLCYVMPKSRNKTGLRNKILVSVSRPNLLALYHHYHRHRHHQHHHTFWNHTTNVYERRIGLGYISSKYKCQLQSKKTLVNKQPTGEWNIFFRGRSGVLWCACRSACLCVFVLLVASISPKLCTQSLPNLLRFLPISAMQLVVYFRCYGWYRRNVKRQANGTQLKKIEKATNSIGVNRNSLYSRLYTSLFA